MAHERKSNYLLKNIFLFFISSFLPKAITFFMVPLYTYCLSTEQYGTIDLLTTTIQLLLPFFTLQIQDAVLRFSLDKNYDSGEIFTTALRIVLAGSGLLVCFCAFGKLLNFIQLDTTYLIMFLLLFFTNAINIITSYFCRGIDKIRILTISNVLHILSTVLCNLLFLLVFKWSIFGYLLAMLIGNITGFLILFFGAKLYQYMHFSVYNKTLLKKIIMFSVPMIFSALSWWINTSLDKYILEYYSGTAAVGLLAIAYKIPSIIFLFGTAIANAYAISAIKDFDKNDSDGFLGSSYTMINIVFTIACSFLMTINVFVSHILFSKEFFVAWKLVPPLLISAVYNQLSLTCEQYYIAMKKTKIISVTAIAGAAINMVANFLLIPKFSAYGAAAATAFSFFVVWLIRYCVLVKYIKLQHSFLAECASYFFLFIQLLLGIYGTQYVLYQGLICLCIVGIYAKPLYGYVLAGYARISRMLKKTNEEIS
ncbi:MAG: hypothetical protein E7400_03165 [Ruminococcaceae bacterium]|nr:hypothetical protein [Oscillospiraceae bacterium]